MKFWARLKIFLCGFLHKHFSRTGLRPSARPGLFFWENNFWWKKLPNRLLDTDPKTEKKIQRKTLSLELVHFIFRSGAFYFPNFFLKNHFFKKKLSWASPAAPGQMAGGLFEKKCLWRNNVKIFFNWAQNFILKKLHFQIRCNLGLSLPRAKKKKSSFNKFTCLHKFPCASKDVQRNFPPVFLCYFVDRWIILTKVEKKIFLFFFFFFLEKRFMRHITHRSNTLRRHSICFVRIVEFPHIFFLSLGVELFLILMKTHQLNGNFLGRNSTWRSLTLRGIPRCCTEGRTALSRRFRAVKRNTFSFVRALWVYSQKDFPSLRRE